MKKIMPILAMLIIVPFVLCSCFAKQVESMSLSYEELELHVGDTKHISVTIKPDGADAGTINWSTSDSKIVTVDDGTVTGKAKGTAVVTAESESGLKRVCNVTILDKEIEGITISESSTSVKKGSKIQLEAKVKPVDAPSDNIVWSSSDPETASVDNNGMVLGENEGVAIITCETENGKKATCTVTVKDTEKKTTVPSTEAPTQAVKQESRDRYPSARYYNYDNDFILPDSSIRVFNVSSTLIISYCLLFHDSALCQFLRCNSGFFHQELCKLPIVNILSGFSDNICHVCNQRLCSCCRHFCLFLHRHA